MRSCRSHRLADWDACEEGRRPPCLFSQCSSSLFSAACMHAFYVSFFFFFFQNGMGVVWMNRIFNSSKRATLLLPKFRFATTHKSTCKNIFPAYLRTDLLLYRWLSISLYRVDRYMDVCMCRVFVLFLSWNKYVCCMRGCKIFPNSEASIRPQKRLGGMDASDKKKFQVYIHNTDPHFTRRYLHNQPLHTLVSFIQALSILNLSLVYLSILNLSIYLSLVYLSIMSLSISLHISVFSR